MAEARIEHLIDCSEDSFWKVFFDAEFNRQLFYDALEFESWKQVSFDDTAARIERVVDVVRDTAGIQAQVLSAAEMSIWTRRRETTVDQTLMRGLGAAGPWFVSGLPLSQTARMPVAR